MPRLAQPIPHRLLIMLALILTLSLAMPELADGKHKRPKRRSGTAEFTVSFVDAGPPRAFTCTWEASFAMTTCALRLRVRLSLIRMIRIRSGVTHFR